MHYYDSLERCQPYLTQYQFTAKGLAIAAPQVMRALKYMMDHLGSEHRCYLREISYSSPVSSRHVNFLLVVDVLDGGSPEVMAMIESRIKATIDPSGMDSLQSRYPLGILSPRSRALIDPPVEPVAKGPETYEERIMERMERLVPKVALNCDHPEYLVVRKVAVIAHQDQILQKFRDEIEAKREKLCECSARGELGKRYQWAHDSWCPAT